MRDCFSCAVGHQSFEIRAIMIMLTRLRDGDDIESDVILTEEGVEKFICHAREIRNVHILSRGRDEFTSDIEFDN